MHKPKNVSCLHMADVVAMPITSETGRNVSPDACQKVPHVNCINTILHGGSYTYTDMHVFDMI